MKYELDELHRNTPDEELLNDLRRVAKELNDDHVTIEAYQKHGRYHPCTLQRRFKSWFKALELAGLPHTRNLGITDQELWANLEAVWEKLGKQPRYSDIKKPLSQYSAGTYEHRFGSWRKALEAFVEYMNAPGAESENASDISNEPAQAEDLVTAASCTTGHRSVNLRLRWKVFQRDKYRCKVCGRRAGDFELQVDHIIPWSKGGRTELENLRLLCWDCNQGKGATLD